MAEQTLFGSRTSNVDFLREVLHGLRRARKQIPSKYFYDEEGSRLFERICELPEYYLTRAELAIMREHAAGMAAALGPNVLLIEYGSGASVKTRFLLDALDRPAAYVPVDISREHLARVARRLSADYPGLAVRPVVTDFTRPFALPPGLPGDARRVVYFPGSTVGNFRPGEARRLLRDMADLASGAGDPHAGTPARRVPAASARRGGAVLIGVDLKKDPAVLHAAYNDAAGVTAAFNRNVLARINRELGAAFDPPAFDHYAFYNPRCGRIEMHLVSRSRQVVRIDRESIPFAEGESIRTEYSYKYTVREFQTLARLAGLRAGPFWADPGRQFSVHLLTAS